MGYGTDWPDTLATDAVSGSALLEDLRATLRDYVIFPSQAALDAVVLWIAATHAQSAWNCATRLVIKAPEKRCGKSRLLDIIEATCHRPLITVNISPAALVRSIGTDPPTLLLDEADTVFGKRAADNHEDLRGIVNAGHQRNRPYIRWDATARAAESCPTFAMVALAGIGDMPETIEDRAVIVAMRRRAAHETVRPYRTRRDAPRLHQLGERLTAWTASVVDTLAEATPAMPIEDRAADNWEPLIAIADTAGGTWPARARSAALVLVHDSEEHDSDRSLGMRLLADIRSLTTGMTFVRSADLVESLQQIEESPWRDFNLTTRQLAARLKRYGVHTGHDTTKTARGYKISEFADAWSRYLPTVTDALGAVRPDTSERPEPAESLASTTDASQPPDGYKRPEAPHPSGPTSQPAWHSDARTDTDDAPPSGNPRCTVCGKPNLFHPVSVERGVCASCVRVVGATQ